MTSHPSFAGLGAAPTSVAARPGHVSAAGHYGFQPPVSPDQHMADKENDAGDGVAFHNGFHNGSHNGYHNGYHNGIHNGFHTGGGDQAGFGQCLAAGGHGSGIGPLGGALCARKRGRDEVVFQEFKRRRLTGEPWTAAPPPVLTPIGGGGGGPAQGTSVEEIRSAVAASARYDRVYSVIQYDLLMEDHGC